MTCINEKHCPRVLCAYPTGNPVFNSNIRELIGYCPLVDMYFDEEKQEAYELSKIPKGKNKVIRKFRGRR